MLESQKRPEKTCTKKYTFSQNDKDPEKLLLVIFLMRFSESSRRELLIYRFSAFFCEQGMCTFKVSRVLKMELEINHVKVRKNSCYNGASKL